MPVRWPLAFYKAANPVGPLPAAVGLGGAARRMLNSLTHTHALSGPKERRGTLREKAGTRKANCVNKAQGNNPLLAGWLAGMGICFSEDASQRNFSLGQTLKERISLACCVTTRIFPFCWRDRVTSRRLIDISVPEHE